MEILNFILNQYFSENDSLKIEKIAGGICNQTYKISTHNEIFILQQLNSIFDKEIIDTVDIISRQMKHFGWQVPVLKKTQSHENYIVDANKRLWRMYAYISGEIVKNTNDFSLLYQFGATLAKFHNDLAKIDIDIPFIIPHFHDTPFFINKLKTLYPSFEKSDVQVTVKQLLDFSENIQFCPNFPQQIIHGDPRLENFLVNDSGNPFTLIDFDTFMKSSIFIDIGDLLRSINVDSELIKPCFNLKNTQKLLVGYLSQIELDAQTFYDNALIGFRQITLELSCRFFIDVIENQYFSWDSEKYDSRQAHNTARALSHFELYNKIKNLTAINLL